MTNPLMACGHVAQGRDQDGRPTCVICVGLDPRAQVVATELPDLSGRMAKCESCSTLRPSSTSLAFFEYRGPGSRRALEHCATCGCTEPAHSRSDRGRHVCSAFTPQGPEDQDRFYCGCRGWD